MKCPNIGLLVLVAVMCCSGLGFASAQSEAPFGLRWGASTHEIRSQGADLKEVQDKTFGASYEAFKVPKVLSDQHLTFLSFGFSDKLWRIIAWGKEVENDPYGYAVRSRYDELLRILAGKYAKPNSVHRLGSSIFSEPRYFVSGIRNGESSWFSNYRTNDLEIQLSIVARDSSTSGWRLIFEYRPLKNVFDTDRKSQEKGAL